MVILIVRLLKAEEENVYNRWFQDIYSSFKQVLDDVVLSCQSLETSRNGIRSGKFVDSFMELGFG